MRDACCIWLLARIIPPTPGPSVLTAADGFGNAQIDYWMKGKPRSDRPARWNLLDAMLGTLR